MQGIFVRAGRANSPRYVPGAMDFVTHYHLADKTPFLNLSESPAWIGDLRRAHA